MKFHQDLPARDKQIILFHTGMKFLRGLWKRLFLKYSCGILLVGRRVRLTHARYITCGKWVKFEDDSEIQGLSRNGLHFGDYVTIGRGTMIRPSSYYGIDIGCGLTMGNHSSIGPNSYIGCAGPVAIGNNVMFGPCCSLLAEQHIFSDANKSIKSQGVTQKGIVIQDDCWIGSGVVILDGVTIGTGSIIGAGTLVTRDVPPGSILTDKRNRCIRPRPGMTENTNGGET